MAKLKLYDIQLQLLKQVSGKWNRHMFQHQMTDIHVYFTH